MAMATKESLELKMDLVKGSFSKHDALDIIAQLIDVKIRYHERMITSDSGEEDIKMRERRIRDLQRDLFDMRVAIENHSEPITLKAEISI